jgi:hypothetical protein
MNASNSRAESGALATCELPSILRITPDGRITGLWTDEVDLAAVGALRVRRASFVEFDDWRQCWCVCEARPRALWRRVLQALLRRPMGRIVHAAQRRSAALDWEDRKSVV